MLNEIKHIGILFFQKMLFVSGILCVVLRRIYIMLRNYPIPAHLSSFSADFDSALADTAVRSAELAEHTA